MRTIQDPKKIEELGRFNKKVSDAHYEYLRYWIKHTVFHWDWWLSFFFTILPWLLWIMFRKKQSTNRLLYVILFVIFFTSWMDFLGVMYGFWRYTGKVIPTMPSYVPWDYCIIPVIVSFIIQIKPKASPWLKALIFSAIAFVGEYFFMWLGFYVPIKWNLIYSIPIYVLLYLISHKLSRMNNFEEV